MDDPIRLLLILIPGLPLAAAVLAATLGPRWLKSQTHWPVLVALLVSLLCSLLLVWNVSYEQQQFPPDQWRQKSGYSEIRRIWTWANVEDAYQQTPTGSHGSASQGWRDFRVDVVLRADSLTAVMLVMVTLISLLVAIYSVGYMQGDRSYWRFFAYFALFVFSMTMLVSVSNFVLLFVFWEAVGLCSYLLIGFWYQKPAAAAAGMKAFLVNRVGDFGFTLALFLIWTTYGTLNFHDTLRDGETDPARIEAVVRAQGEGQQLEPGQQPVLGVLGKWRLKGQLPAAGGYQAGTVGLAICLLLLVGACGKSAQFPLHVWLPDAMEGPTPVSALIHAATMVTAGVYMVIRCTPLFMASPDAQLVVSGIGALTALLAALIALTQFDLKRVLAYSTISQLGYMFLALGTGTLAGITAGMFHLFTHAFFKALLFLGAGSVMHAMGNVIDMRRFGGLRKRMPVTHLTFAVGCLALAGVMPFAGFWSKDAVMGAVHDKAHDLRHVTEHGHASGEGAAPGVPALLVAHPGGEHEDIGPHAMDTSAVFGLLPAQRAVVYEWFYVIALLTAFLTAFYTFRAFFMTFYGEERIPIEAGDHAHESPSSMTWPLACLAFFAAIVGLLFDRSYIDGRNLFAELLMPTPSLAAGLVADTRQPGDFHLSVAALSSLLALSGLGLALYFYLGSRREIHRIREALDLAWIKDLSDVESVSRLRRMKWVQVVYNAARQVGLGWLAALLGNIVLLLALVLSAPLLLILYVSPYQLSWNKFYFDELYDALVVRPLRGIAWLSYAVDRWVIDGLVDLCGRIPPFLGSLMRSLQTGLVQFYALAMVLGVLVLILARIWAGR